MTEEETADANRICRCLHLSLQLSVDVETNEFALPVGNGDQSVLNGFLAIRDPDAVVGIVAGQLQLQYVIRVPAEQIDVFLGAH